jgi:energy-converting hydrogenase Eha subunit B
MTIRKVIGLLIALLGIVIGAILSGSMLILLFAYYGAPENPGSEGNIVLGISALFGAAIGYGIYRLGRKIAN